MPVQVENQVSQIVVEIQLMNRIVIGGGNLNATTATTESPLC